MIHVLIGKDLALEGSTSLNIEDKQVPGTIYIYILSLYIYNIYVSLKY